MATHLIEDSTLYDIAVVGYGPAGLTAASLLSGLGHRVLVLERWPTLYGRPRVATLLGEVGRILQAACDVDLALRNAKVRNSIAMVNEAGDVIHARKRGDELHTAGFPQMLSIHQPEVEDALDQRVRENGATIFQGWELVDLTQIEDMVLVTAKETNKDTGTGQRSFRSRYLIAADGARSTVRDLLGIERDSWPFRNAWHAVDTLHLRPFPPTSKYSRDGSSAVHVCAPEGRARSIIPLGTDHLRFTFEVNPDADNTHLLNRETAYRMLQEAFGLTQEDVEVHRQAIFTFEGKLARTWRAGRAFLAGDAAHLMTPFLGEGGCSALRDAINLSWKLHLVLTHRADARILDTYETERKPHVRAYIDGSDELAAIVFTRDPVDAARRDEEFMSGKRDFHYPTPAVGEGIFNKLEGGERDPAAGENAPQGRIVFEGIEGRFDDFYDWGFQLLGWESDPAESLTDEQREFLNMIGCTVVGLSTEPNSSLVHSLDDQYSKYFLKRAVKYVLVRPDYLTFGAAVDAQALGRLIDNLRHQLQPA